MILDENKFDDFVNYAAKGVDEIKKDFKDGNAIKNAKAWLTDKLTYEEEHYFANFSEYADGINEIIDQWNDPAAAVDAAAEIIEFLLECNDATTNVLMKKNPQKLFDFFIKWAKTRLNRTWNKNLDDKINNIIFKGMKKATDTADKVTDKFKKHENLGEDFTLVVPLNDQSTDCTDPLSCVPQSILDDANKVMGAYQNANKWLDTTKETIYTDLGCVFFSSFIHMLAHTMPERFDKFGDILHTCNVKIPYPATADVPFEVNSIDSAFKMIFTVLDAIKEKLNFFIKDTDENYHGMSCAAETLLNDIEAEYPMLYRLRQEWENCANDMAKFDKYVGQYVKEKDNLVESLNESEKTDNELTEVELLNKYRLNYHVDEVNGLPKIVYDFTKQELEDVIANNPEIGNQLDGVLHDIEKGEDNVRVEKEQPQEEEYGSVKYNANEGRKARIADYRAYAGLKDEDLIEEANLNDYALHRTASKYNCGLDRVKAEVLGQKWSDYEI